MKRYISSTSYIQYDNEGNEIPAEIVAQLKSSKIRNRQGELIVCYHGTNAQFAEFQEDFISSNSGNIGWFGKGFYFTDNETLAKSYGSTIRKCYLDIRNPFIYSSPDSIYTLLSLNISPRSYDGRLQPYAYLDDPTPIEEFTQAIKDAGYDGVKFSYKQGKYKSNIRGTSSATEYVCFNTDQVIFIQ